MCQDLYEAGVFWGEVQAFRRAFGNWQGLEKPQEWRA